METFNASITFDKRMWEEDIKVHVYYLVNPLSPKRAIACNAEFS